jgi:hypothetical protein
MLPRRNGAGLLGGQKAAEHSDYDAVRFDNISDPAARDGFGIFDAALQVTAEMRHRTMQAAAIAAVAGVGAGLCVHVICSGTFIDAMTYSIRKVFAEAKTNL